MNPTRGYTFQRTRIYHLVLNTVILSEARTSPVNFRELQRCYLEARGDELGTKRCQSNNETQSIFCQLQRWLEESGASTGLVWAPAWLGCPALSGWTCCVAPKEDSRLQESGLTLHTGQSRSQPSGWCTRTAQTDYGPEVWATQTSSGGPKEAPLQNNSP